MLRAIVWAVVWGALAVAALARAGEERTALDDYVETPDAEFAWKLVSQQTGPGYMTSILEVTSQRWRSEAEVDRPVWKHWLSVVRPDQMRAAGAGGSRAFLFIGGGENGGAPPTDAAERTRNLALAAHTVVAELQMVPNQPLRFADSPGESRVEDDIIGYSRVKFMATGDPTWLVRLAMVKSGVRGLDALQQFCATAEGGRLKLERFVVAGGSKRGWTTWLVGLEDPRVEAIIPLVIDALNSEQITRHHFRAYGFFSSALDDYVKHKLFPDKIGTPQYDRVLAIEDPYRYRHRERLKLPKLLINAAGDEFFLPDNAQFYYHDMPQEKHLRYVPNAKHNLAGSDAAQTVLAFYQMILSGKPRPRFTWKKNEDGSLAISTTDRPREARLWQATNPKARDFRLDVIGPAYTSTPLEPSSDGGYLARVAPPAEGYTAFFAEFTFPGATAEGPPLKLTTEVSVVPDVLPFEFPKSKP